MPSHQDNLAAVRAACIAANPEIASLQPGCEFDWTGEDYVERRMVVARALGTESIDGTAHGFELYVYEKDNAASQISSISSDDFEEGESFESFASNIGRPITAADVLLALGEVLGRKYLDIADGKLYIGVPNAESEEAVDHIWLDLRANLSGWSEEAVAALANLFEKNH